MIVLIGESGSGKTSIAKYLISKLGYDQIVSYTTRPPREGEVDGVDYNFITKEKFLDLRKRDFFAETTKYNDWYYGSPIYPYLQEHNRYYVAILTPHGFRQIKKNCPDSNVISFYINVPRRDRLIKILQRGDNIEEAYRRSLSDIRQFDGIKSEVDWVINNPNYSKTIEEATIDILNRSALTLFGIVENIKKV